MNQIWPFKFDPVKATQLVAHLLRHADPQRQQDNYTRVLKLLYLTERECLAQRTRPLLGDHPVAMKNGPVLSGVYDLIMNRYFDASYWNRHIVRRRFDIALISDPGVDALSPFEMKLVERVVAENQGKDQWELIDIVHELPEWVKNAPGTGTSAAGAVPIPLDDLLDSLGLSGKRDEMVDWARELSAGEASFPSVGAA